MAAKPSGLDPELVEAGRARLLHKMFGLDLLAPETTSVSASAPPPSARQDVEGHLAPGTLLLDKYVVERELGRGGMGVVLAVRHRGLDELFALKLLLPKAQSSPELIARFVREARATARLTSAHVPRVHDVGQLDDGTPYLLMEYLEGEDLAEHVAAGGRLPLERSLALILQACDALSEAHGLGLVHRDLKPANMFVTRRHTGEAHLKLLDFGITKQLDAEELTLSGMLIGTPRYMSPEQLRGRRDVDARADIWALGVILYELSTGERPFSASSLGELINQTLTATPERPSEVRPGLPRALDELISRCLAKQPEHRYGSLTPLIDELRQLLADTDSLAREPDPDPDPDPTMAVGVASTRTTQLSTGGLTLEQPEGLVDAGSPLYVTRPEFERPCLEEITKPGALLRIKGPRQMGKTTMMVRLLEHARGRGARIVRVDLQLADTRHLSELDQLLRWLCAVVRRRLRLDKFEDEWEDIFGPKDNCLSAFEEHFLPAADSPLVLALSSIDRLFEWPQVAEDFLAFLRALHELGSSLELWSRFRLVLEYSTEMYLPMDINHSPFNVGHVVAMTEWDAGIIRALALRHGLRWGDGEVAALMDLVGGHPYLVRVALYRIAQGMPLDALLETASTDEGVFAHHLKQLVWRLRQQPELAAAASRVVGVREPIRVRTELAFKLVSLGIARQRGDEIEAGRALYRHYLARHLDDVPRA